MRSTRGKGDKCVGRVDIKREVTGADMLKHRNNQNRRRFVGPSRCQLCVYSFREQKWEEGMDSVLY